VQLKSLFESGSDFNVFLEKAEAKDREKFEVFYKNTVFSEKILERLSTLKKKIKVLVFSEPWCPDCVVSLPVLAKMAELNNLIEFAILPREGHEDFLERYKYDGKPRVPTFIFMNEDFEELGAFVEIPSFIKEIYKKGYQPDIIVARRNYRQGKYTEEIASEFLDIMEGKLMGEK